MIVKNADELIKLREGGKRLSHALSEAIACVRPGIPTSHLDAKAEEVIRSYGDVPSFLGYRPKGAKREYPATLCVSVNDEVVHGIPGDRILLAGDIVGLDVGLIHEGVYLDMAVTAPVGEISSELTKLLSVTKESLQRGIAAVRVGNTIGAIGEAIEEFVTPYGYGIVRELGGHGVGAAVHEEPFIPNFVTEHAQEKIMEGMVLALEPMLTLGHERLTLASDGFTYKTQDGSYAAHFEHTVVATKEGPEILTAFQ